MSERVKQIVPFVVDWFMDQDDTYIIVFGAVKLPQLSPKLAKYRVVLQEIAYQVYKIVGEALLRTKKLSWLHIPFQLGAYELKDINEALTPYIFGDVRFHKYDPRS